MQQEDLIDLRNSAWGKPITAICYPGKKQFVAVEKGDLVPRTESLADCADRVLPLWIHAIAPRVSRGETVLIVAHANSIRSMVKHIDIGAQRTHLSFFHIPLSLPLSRCLCPSHFGFINLLYFSTSH